MSPNPIVLAKLVFSPKQWFTSKPPTPQQSRKSSVVQEHWNSPIPGIYEHRPGRGWYLVHIDLEQQSSHLELKLPQPVTYCRILHRYMLREDYLNRRQHGQVKDSDGTFHIAGFFLLDDNITWVKAWDQKGVFLGGPFERWIIDAETKKFRIMRYSDDMDWVKSKSSARSSIKASESGMCSACGSSRANSTYKMDFQGSSSTGPGSIKDGGTNFTTPRSGFPKAGEVEAISAKDLQIRLAQLNTATT